MEEFSYYLYVSTRADYNPVKTFFICPPAAQCATLEKAEAFAKASGWQALAEYDGAAVVVPVVPNGWEKEPELLLSEIFNQFRNKLPSRNGRSLLGRKGTLWSWETLVYLVGYADGAVFAGNSVVSQPNLFAASALIGGAPSDYSAGDRPSSHWLVKNVSADYNVCNRQIPSSLWLMNVPAEEETRALAYFAEADGFALLPEEKQMGEIPALCYHSETNPAQQVLVSREVALTGMDLANAILENYFEKMIRWKDGPDGSLRLHLGRTGFYTDSRFIHSSVVVNALEYSYSVHLPEGMTKEEVKGLPLVFSVHGRGEPAWLFAEKNGWDVLADKTQAFVLVAPDSAGNIWNLKRDGAAFGLMVDKICTEYGLDRSRVYLTGFSNGGAITREVGSTYPQLFAAIAPYNAPVLENDAAIGAVLAPTLLPSGVELPYWMYIGDNDAFTQNGNCEQMEIMLAVNGCRKSADPSILPGFAPDEIRTGENWYTPEKGYTQGDRFTTYVYHGSKGDPRVGFTVMKNMPHGAIVDQSLATWEFLKHFRRPNGGKEVEYLLDPERRAASEL